MSGGDQRTTLQRLIGEAAEASTDRDLERCVAADAAFRLALGEAALSM